MTKYMDAAKENPWSCIENYYAWLLKAWEEYTKCRKTSKNDYWSQKFTREINKITKIIQARKQLRDLELCNECEIKFFVVN